MTKKNTDKIQRTPSKNARIQGYKLALRERRVSGTVGQTYSSFDDTASFPSGSQETFNVPRTLAAERTKRKFSMDLKTIGIIFGIIAVLCGATYKFGVLEKSVEFVQKGLTEIQNRMGKIEEEHKKDYQHLDEKLNDHIIKNKK